MRFQPVQNKHTGSSGKHGFSLVESLICLSLFLFMLLSAFHVFSTARSHFDSLQKSQETYIAACAALDKIKTDVQNSGLKLTVPVSLGLLEPVSAAGGILDTISAENSFTLAEELPAGTEFIPLSSTEPIKQGNEMCIFDKEKGEVILISAVDENGVRLSSPLTNSYTSEKTAFILLKKICFFLDTDTDVLRRKVNTSPAQPLCENVGAFDCTYDASTNLAEVRLGIFQNPERYYEMCIFPKNTALAAVR